MMTSMAHAACPHPPAQYYTWWAYNCVTNTKDWLVIGCTQCHEILKGSNEEYERYLAQHTGEE